ncbi:LysR substrate-binding domain-containing protein [Marinobacter sp. F3R08]|uniref:LysR substrate-binding domain-containing protein n=1 Tax=Marinobacter sp. F3R08 TaxID=2841559 RepID=UPI001C086C3B|nr:LysR substrate-binding domain-containing protein [Marinobacter sp. F3R08]MBU2955842.1 LysR family transcriptional regulator [Marinobacter sp. F3R08]
MLSRITQRQLEYFVASGEAGSIQGASERIHVSSPSISAAITHIESELGVQLFVRHHAQGISLTPIGREIVKEAKTILDQMTSLYTIASESLNTVRGPLRVGCMASLAPMLTPELVVGFGRAFPGVRISQAEGDHEELLSKLRNGEVDIVLTYDLVSSDDTEFHPLARLPAYVMVGENHALANLSAVTINDLETHPMVLLDIPSSRDYFLSLFRPAGVTPNIVMKSSNLEVIRAMVANGVGYSIANVRPKANLSLDGKRLIRLRLAGDHQSLRLGYVTLKNVQHSRVVNAFAERCCMFVSDQYIPGMAAPSFFDPHTVRSLKGVA